MMSLFFQILNIPLSKIPLVNCLSLFLFGNNVVSAQVVPVMNQRTISLMMLKTLKPDCAL